MWYLAKMKPMQRSKVSKSTSRLCKIKSLRLMKRQQKLLIWHKNSGLYRMRIKINKKKPRNCPYQNSKKKISPIWINFGLRCLNNGPINTQSSQLKNLFRLSTSSKIDSIMRLILRPKKALTQLTYRKKSLKRCRWLQQPWANHSANRQQIMIATKQ